MGPLEKELDEMIQRIALGSSAGFRAAGGEIPSQQELIEFYGELIGAVRSAVLRVAREIDDLRAAGTIGDEWSYLTGDARRDELDHGGIVRAPPDALVVVALHHASASTTLP